MITKFNFSLYLRTSKKNKNGESAIFIRVLASNGEVFRLSSSIYLLEDFWNEETQLSSKLNTNHEMVNIAIEKVKFKFEQLQRKIQVESLELNATQFKNFLNGVENKPILLLDFFNQRIEELQALGFKNSTIEVYKHCLENLIRSSKHNRWPNGLALKEFNYPMLLGFEGFLRKVRGCNDNTIAKYMKTLKAVFNDALKKELISTNPFKNYQVRWVQTERQILSLNEINAIELKEFKLPRLKACKDMFLFACYTGISYADIVNLKLQNIKTGENGMHYLSFNRQKTNEECNVPLPIKALEILLPYLDDLKQATDKVFSMITNQKINAYLKEIGDLCGIEKNLTFHMARHTFATTICLEGGVNITTIQKLLGQSKITTTMIYARTKKSLVLESKSLLDSRLSGI